MSLSAPVVRRLGLIKYMFGEGLKQSRRPSPAFVTALLTFQDAAELFLHLACNHHQVEPKDQTFMGYFSALENLGVTGRQGLHRLNKARVAFKHHGNLPHDDDMEFFRFTVTAFFDENTPALFDGVRFADISLSDMVTCEKARAHLTTAEDHWNNRRREDARRALALAYDELHWDYKERNREPRWGQRPFDLGPSLTFASGSGFHLQGDAKRFVDDVVEILKRMRSALEVMALGIDYKKHVEFKMLTPIVQRSANGDVFVAVRNSLELSQQEYERCFNFVIEAALKLQEFDFAFAAAHGQEPSGQP